MGVLSTPLRALAVLYPLFNTAFAGSLKDIDHVILFMQENRAFDHYFGTMAGVRGFSDPNVQVNDGIPVWKQVVNSNLTTEASSLLPWYLNYEGGEALNATQCMVAGDNGWVTNHNALNGDLNNHWATGNTPWSWGHFKRSDLPIQFAIADGWTVGDMYQESVIASTNPNRVTWVSGSINTPGSPQNPDEGGNPYIDNNETPGCETGGYSCYPLKWKTTPEIYQDTGVSWGIYQDADNFDDNPLAWFKQFQDAAAGTPLASRGFDGQTLETFYAQAANGTLPAVSFIIGPSELSEHPPYRPRDGAWLQKKVVEAVTRGAKYKNSALIISYDETGGWGDHVTPYHSPPGTAGEWIEDPYKEVGYTYTGPGFRLPFYIISPWTRGSHVFTEHADHNSQILFLEQWLQTKGHNVRTDQMVEWRRQHMSNLVNAFDFEHPDYSLPDIPYAEIPHVDSTGAYDGAAHCEALFPVQRPEVPYASQVKDVASWSEKGFKAVRGALTEGRYLTFELGGAALTNGGFQEFSSGKATAAHDDVKQHWILHEVVAGGNEFLISSAADGRYWGPHLTFCGKSEAQSYAITFEASKGSALRATNGQYLTIDRWGSVRTQPTPAFFSVYSVT